MVININTQIMIFFDDTSSYTVIDNPDDSASIAANKDATLQRFLVAKLKPSRYG